MRFESKGDYINGQWIKRDELADGQLTRVNPSRKQELVFEATWRLAAVDEAIEAARAALPAWDRLGFEARLAHVERFGQVLGERKEALAQAIAAEAGKPMWEARTEAGALVSKIQIMSTEGAQYTATSGNGRSERAVYRPLGVLAVLGPFNFPLHLPNGHIIPALLTGNTVVVKPSELTSACMQLYMECAQEAGIPQGVLNMVLGPGAVGARLVAHERVSGVLFTGSYETGLAIKRATLEQPWKLLALEMGGKNTTIVLSDADLDQAAHELIQASFLTAGQRCTATSRLIIERPLVDALTDKLRALAERITTGDALTEEVFMGPLINEAAHARFLRAQEDDEGGNLERVLAGGLGRPDLDGYFVKPAIWRVKDLGAPAGLHQTQELFGPDLVIYGVEDEEQAVTLANGTDFGLAMSVFSASRERFERLSYALEAGVLNWNRSTAGASSKLPFGGVKRSGNHRPAAITAGLYCTYPQAQLLVEPGFDEQAASQSMPLRLIK